MQFFNLVYVLTIASATANAQVLFQTPLTDNILPSTAGNSAVVAGAKSGFRAGAAGSGQAFSVARKASRGGLSKRDQRSRVEMQND